MLSLKIQHILFLLFLAVAKLKIKSLLFLVYYTKLILLLYTQLSAFHSLKRSENLLENHWSMIQYSIPAKKLYLKLNLLTYHIFFLLITKLLTTYPRLTLRSS